MYDNALRCTEADYPVLLAMGTAMGAVSVDGLGNIIPAAGVEWDYIGYKPIGGGQFLEDGQGNKYVHINIRTPFSVGQAAAQLALIYPEIGSALSNPGRFFIVDGTGEAVLPEVPMRVFL